MIGNKNGVGQVDITTELHQIFSALGKGRVNSVAYDTAWIARLSTVNGGSHFKGALPWLRSHQHADGSWGGDILYYHDRFICTISALIALSVNGDKAQDADRMRKAENFLWRDHVRLHQDTHETIGFPVLAVSLIEEARLLGIEVPRNPYCDTQAIDQKLTILQQSPELWRKSTMSFSLEAIRACFPDEPDFLEGNGSVGTSPAATASLLLRSGGVSHAALDYLQRTVLEDGGMPNVSPIDTFEIAWSLNYLRHAGVITPDEAPVRRALDELWKAWSKDKGMGFSSYYSVRDLDDTAVGYAMLRWGGYPVEADIFAQFEEEDHFRCFPHEIDPSLSATLRLVDALKLDPTHPKYEAWMEKAVGMLRRHYNSGVMWFDKWHASPYYPVYVSVQALRGVADDIVATQVRWLLSAQQDDGGWGYYASSTPEETAYALMALFAWDEYAVRINPDVIQAGAAYLMQHFGRGQLTPLWLGKCLYTPEYVVRSLIVAALFKFYSWCDSQ